MKKRIVLVLLSVLLISGIIGVLEISSTDADTNKPISKYEKPSVQDITGLGDSPYEISSKASAVAVEKQWFEYITYSNQSISETIIDSNTRLVFYDPYSYVNATIMELQGTEEDWSSANTITHSYTSNDSVSWGYSDTTTETESITGTNADGILNIKDSGIHSREGKKWEDVSTKEGHDNNYSVSVDTNIPVISQFVDVDGEWAQTFYHETTTNEIADRFSRTYGLSHTENKSNTYSKSETRSYTFNATYFNQYGSPLQWKVIMYQVYLPIKVNMQKKINGEWYTVDTAYCKLKMLNGFSRSYIKDNKTYAEDWGTGEPILWEEFEKSFLTPEKLIDAYKSKLLPNE